MLMQYNAEKNQGGLHYKLTTYHDKPFFMSSIKMINKYFFFFIYLSGIWFSYKLKAGGR